MKKFFQIISTLFIVLMIITPVCATSDDRGTYIPNNETGIPDLALYEYIKNQTKKDEVYSNDLIGITEMRLSDKLYSIKSLKGLDLLNMPELRVLDLDISTLETLEDILSLSSIKELYLRNSSLNELTPDISKLNNLYLLSIQGSNITTLPDELFNLVTLNTLILDQVPLTELGDGIERLVNLEQLELHNMNFKIPLNVYNLSHLKVLVFNNMGITKIDNEITKLLMLQTLNLGYNEITEIPSFFYSMNSLQELVLRNNKIKAINSTIELLTNLRSLDLSNNELETLPIQLINIQNLRSLVINNNNFTCLPNDLALLKLDGVFDFFKFNEVERCEVEEEPDVIEELEISVLDNVVSNNGYTNKSVTVYSDVEVYFIVNGVTMDEMANEYTVDAEGKYSISAMRQYEGTANTINFTIDKTGPVISIRDNDLKLTGFTTEVVVESNESGTFYVNGEKQSGNIEMMIISDNNDYEIYQYDLAGNKSNVLSFYVDKPIIDPQPGENSNSTNIVNVLLYLIVIIVLAVGSFYFLRKGASLERED